ncbi:hypothetical protein [Neobacillus niacini]|uniref:hypothetical protein n=1 Tax=Neobacillus niacini TaxID=86668 RepID=UPI00187D0020|nr:hypothetical protein [Neobacillus niacini]
MTYRKFLPILFMMIAIFSFIFACGGEKNRKKINQLKATMKKTELYKNEYG